MTHTTEPNGPTMPQPGVLERIATALETIATMLTGTPTPTPRTPYRPDPAHSRFEWEPDTDTTPVTPLPEPTPPQERCGFLIEQYTNALDRVTPIIQISKSGASVLLNEQEAAQLAALSDEEFTATMAGRLAQVLAERHREARAPAEPAAAPADGDVEDEDEARQREWARTVGAAGPTGRAT